MKVSAVILLALVLSVSAHAQPAMLEPPEFPGQVPGPVAEHPGTGCFLLASGNIVPGDVDWVQVSIPWPSTQTVVDVDFPAGAGSSALIATLADGSRTAFNQSDSNNPRDALCGLSGSSSPPGSSSDSVVTLLNTPGHALFNIGITASQDTGFLGYHNQSFAYDVWVRIQAVLCTSDYNCADAVACTMDTCDVATGVCTSTPNNSACDNGQFCDGTERCDSRLDCRPGLAPDCEDDDVDCTDDYCDTAADACVHEPFDEFCDDGSFCNGWEVCDVLTDCQAGTPPDCDDNVDCTTDSCDDADGACVHTPEDSACDNGLFCDGEEYCDALKDCRPGVPPDCDDGVSCTTDSCDDADGSCVHTPEDSACDNGLFCDGEEYCDALKDCRPGVPPDCDDGVSCTTDSCDGADGSCVHTPEDSACDNGLFCDGEEYCDALKDCRPGVPPDCDDGVSCTTDSCDGADGSCVHTPEDSACDNGLFCDGEEYCDALTDCQPSVPPDCDDGVSCTTDSCDDVDGVCAHTPDDSTCDNGLFCDGGETCDTVKGCLPGAEPCGPDESCNEDGQSCLSAAVGLDIKPGDCPNRLQRFGTGHFSAAIVGSAAFDVRQVDFASIRLSRTDGVGGSAAPDRAFARRDQSAADVATPFVGESCGCHALAGDGVPDLRLHFSTADVFEKLRLSRAEGTVELQITVRLRNGSEFTASDCVVLPHVRDFGRRP